ncbi:aldehyde oxidase 1-like [Sabethes cyaneus]|uniref:aldehyde oxidase 1-like n=1 Tax=Sabethes cyaneus TaxID=53552 RepID=UPI00237ECA24|nr:aldehyde oxidase 1-like [Sabethes cyaneus]
MCREGGCGSCVVSVSEVHPITGDIITKSVNSCLLPVYSCHGRDIVTTEGIGSKTTGYHPVQRRLAAFNGSQCGYCSAGMVMSMYSLLEANQDAVTMHEVEDSLDGNICRCTGYRPILDAFKSFATDASSNIVTLCRDIEEIGIGKDCSRKICKNVCGKLRNSFGEKTIHLKEKDGKEWYKVFSVSSIQEIFKTIADKQYMLVNGNTAHGVYRRRDDLEVFIDVSSVKSLHERSIGQDLTIGANVSLSEFIEIMNEAVRENLRFQYMKSLIEHVRLVANRSVRNFGTIAGNLMIKHQHPEFPSDIFLLLETAGATILIETDSLPIVVSPMEFLTVNMTKKIIVSITVPSLDPTNSVFRSFKIMPVAKNSRAYVNAGFLVKFCRTGKISEQVTIVFGGINPAFVHASQTENFLLGRPLLNNDTLQQAVQILCTELEPDWVLPDASPAYRKQLAISLFYKFVLNLAVDDSVELDPKFKSGGSKLQRPLSMGKQSYDTYPKKWPLTQNIPKIEGLAQTSGEAEYINDMPQMVNELHAAFVLAKAVHVRIVKIDASKALAIEGVIAFYSAKNIPGINNYMPLELGNSEVEEIFCSGEVKFHSQPIGLVVAESFELANRAAALVDVCYERIPNIPLYVTVQQVLENHAYHRIENQGFDRHGALYSRSSAQGPIKIQGYLNLADQYHYSMETQACFCVPKEDGMDIYSATQYTTHVMIAVSEALKVPQSRLNLSVRRLGGAYGGKIAYSAQIACACAVAAHLSQRPIRMILLMESNVSAIGKRMGSRCDYEVDVDRDGKINRLNCTYTHDGGASTNTKLAFMTSDVFKNCYLTDRWNLVGNIARTDVPPNTWCRSPGSSDGIAMIENIMEHIAHVTGKDPLAVRRVNMSRENRMIELMPKFRKDVNFDERKKDINMFNTRNRWRKRGIAIIPMEYPLEYSGTRNALVSVYNIDGSVAVTHGAVEMGQGVNTKVAQVIAHFLGVPLEKISVKPTTSLTSPNDSATVNSRASETAAFAVKKCCDILLERLRPLREANPTAPWEQITAQAFAGNIDLTAFYHHKPSDLEAYVIWGLTCAEIEVDILTGNVQITRVEILEDVGESMSPGIDIGQVEGSFIMGLGYYLTEALVYDFATGELVNNRSWNYKVPGVKDIPIDFRVQFLRNSSNPHGVLRSKAVGEPAFSMTPVLTYALRHALRSARKDAGLADDWIPMGTGITPEKIFLMAGNSIDQYKLN